LKYDPQKHHRRSIRLEEYDYSRAGAYFITVCAHRRECLFGRVVDGEMRLNEAGQIVESEWLKTPSVRAEIELDAWILMPNHFHCIVRMHGGTGRGDRPVAPTDRIVWAMPCGPKPASVGAWVAGFKSATTKRINIQRGSPGVPVWQRNYYEHIVRDNADRDRIRRYISNNPVRWELDQNHVGPVLDVPQT
jgi:REP element-mobilizing transposase RayT